MQAIIDFFIGVGDFLKSIVTFIIDTISDLVYVVKLIGSMVAQIPSLIGWLPAGCIALLLTLFGVVVVYKILGRD